MCFVIPLRAHVQSFDGRSAGWSRFWCVQEQRQTNVTAKRGGHGTRSNANTVKNAVKAEPLAYPTTTVIWRRAVASEYAWFNRPKRRSINVVMLDNMLLLRAILLIFFSAAMRAAIPWIPIATAESSTNKRTIGFSIGEAERCQAAAKPNRGVISMSNNVRMRRSMDAWFVSPGRPITTASITPATNPINARIGRCAVVK